MITSETATIDVRRQELNGCVADGDLKRASDRLLDFARDYASGTDLMNQAIVLSGKARMLLRRARIEQSEIDDQAAGLLDSILALSDDIASRYATLLSATVRVGEAAPTVSTTQPQSAKVSQASPLFGAAGPEVHGMAERQVLVRVSQLRKTHRKAEVPFSLADISFEIGEGELVGVLGPNGAGKTTLLRSVAGELAPDAGTVHLAFASDRVEARRRIAYVRQQPARWWGSVEEAVTYAAVIRGVSESELTSQVQYALHRLSLDRYSTSPWSELSVGFQMRVELAKAIVWKPKLLVLDEPLAPLDIGAQYAFLQDLRDLARSESAPMGVIMSSQHIDETEACADKVLVLLDGRQRYFGTAALIQSEHVIIEAQSEADVRPALEFLRTVGMTAVQRAGFRYRFTFDKRLSAHQAIAAVVQRVPSVKVVQDVSSSARRLFSEEF
jgi:ABC-2 type transport system ATP-binding protein